ncbi:MAG: Stp1/IreP family PP2C-type Ser/Thr phosphatase [Giesbergeria sp.]
MSAASMIYEFCARTDTGRVRTNNEDAVSVDSLAQLALLADGMGGYNAGEVASTMAINFIRDEMARWLAQAGPRLRAFDVRRAMEICVDNANQGILQAAEANPQYAGMGTTLVLGVFQGPRLMLGHIGDSRCYRLRGAALEVLTRDHSWLQEQIDAGLITPQQAAASTSRNLVTRALGVEEMVLLEVNEFEVQAGDLYMLCSDGLSEMVEHADITALLGSRHSLDEMATRLIETANNNGGRDNISVVLAKASTGPRKQGLMSRLLRT